MHRPPSSRTKAMPHVCRHSCLAFPGVTLGTAGAAGFRDIAADEALSLRFRPRNTAMKTMLLPRPLLHASLPGAGSALAFVLMLLIRHFT